MKADTYIIFFRNSRGGLVDQGIDKPEVYHHEGSYHLISLSHIFRYFRKWLYHLMQITGRFLLYIKSIMDQPI